MIDDEIVVVSGLPRSGTSLMMRMLHAGGLEPLTDEERKPDPDNPGGYYEFERVKKLPADTEWLPMAKGKAVKILGELIKHLPSGYIYRIIFMMRDFDEIIASQKKMLIRSGEDPDKVPEREMADLLRRYLVNLKRYINRQDNMEVIYVSYNEIMEDPEEVVEEIDDFFENGLDTSAMIECVDPGLYRNRSV